MNQVWCTTMQTLLGKQLCEIFQRNMWIYAKGKFEKGCLVKWQNERCGKEK